MPATRATPPTPSGRAARVRAWWRAWWRARQAWWRARLPALKARWERALEYRLVRAGMRYHFGRGALFSGGVTFSALLSITAAVTTTDFTSGA